MIAWEESPPIMSLMPHPRPVPRALRLHHNPNVTVQFSFRYWRFVYYVHCWNVGCKLREGPYRSRQTAQLAFDSELRNGCNGTVQPG